jgi:hypothetical protein
MDVSDLVAKQNKLNSLDYYVFNPFDYDFKFSWGGETYIIPACKTKSFPHYLREHAAKKLIEQLIIKHDVKKVTPQVLKKYRKEVVL